MGLLKSLFTARAEIVAARKKTLAELARIVAESEHAGKPADVDTAELAEILDAAGMTDEDFAKKVKGELGILTLAERASSVDTIRDKTTSLREANDKANVAETRRRKAEDEKRIDRENEIRLTEQSYIAAYEAKMERDMLLSHRTPPSPRLAEIEAERSELLTQLRAAESKLKSHDDGWPTISGSLATLKGQLPIVRRTGSAHGIASHEADIRGLSAQVKAVEDDRDKIKRQLDELNREWRDVAAGNSANNSKAKTKGSRR